MYKINRWKHQTLNVLAVNATGNQTTAISKHQEYISKLVKSVGQMLKNANIIVVNMNVKNVEEVEYANIIN